ncbi:hypothetical protein Tco_0058643, partial [Tanacetum coccineum]
LFQTMLVQGQILQGEGSTIPVESHHTPIVALLTSQPHHSPILGDFIRQETEVPHPSSPTQTHVTDEATSIGVDDRHGGATTTVSGLDAGQGNKVEVLENDLKQTKRVYGDAFTKLIKKVKTLEKTVKLSKARRKTKLVVSDDAELDSFNQGRKIAKIDEDPDISLFTTHDEVYTAEPDISTANVPVSTAGAKVSTAILEVSTAAESLVYIKRSATKRVDKGKAIMKEAEPVQKKTKVQLEQERLGYEEDLRLQEQLDEEERKRLARVYEEASTFNVQEWDDIQAQIEADEEFALRLQAEERGRYSEADKARLLVELINERKRLLHSKELNKGGTSL